MYVSMYECMCHSSALDDLAFSTERRPRSEAWKGLLLCGHPEVILVSSDRVGLELRCLQAKAGKQISRCPGGEHVEACLDHLHQRAGLVACFSDSGNADNSANGEKFYAVKIDLDTDSAGV